MFDTSTKSFFKFWVLLEGPESPLAETSELNTAHLLAANGFNEQD